MVTFGVAGPHWPFDPRWCQRSPTEALTVDEWFSHIGWRLRAAADVTFSLACFNEANLGPFNHAEEI
jgi:hypothetical protein